MLEFPPMMRTLSKPSIVAINGIALGIGATMTLPCDIRIMADTAKIGFIFARVGLMPELGSSYLLPRLIGASRAAEVMLTGRHYSAAECLAMGIVSQVVAAEMVMAKAREIASEIIQGSPLSLALTRRAIHQGLTGRWKARWSSRASRWTSATPVRSIRSTSVRFWKSGLPTEPHQ